MASGISVVELKTAFLVFQPTKADEKDASNGDEQHIDRAGLSTV